MLWRRTLTRNFISTLSSWSSFSPESRLLSSPSFLNPQSSTFKSPIVFSHLFHSNLLSTSTIPFTTSPFQPNPATPPITVKGDDNDDNDCGGDDNDDNDCGGDEEEDECFDHLGSTIENDADFTRHVDEVMTIMGRFSLNAIEAKQRLELCEISVSSELVMSVLSRIRNDWSAAYTFFLWAGKQRGYSHSVREYHTMISILGKFRKFDTAWSLISEMRRTWPSLVKPQTLTILIRRYSAAHEVAKAISCFHSLKKFGFTPGIEGFQCLLSALCRYKNVEDAEHLLMCNEKTYPFETKSFNIILNGWCNVLVFVREAKRFWKSMEERGILLDVVSYGSMLSCFSKAGNLNDVLKMFYRMRESGIEPDRKVYNAVIYALAKSKCVKEAKDLFRSMEEKRIHPNAVSYNSLIRPLCKARRVEEARELFDEMVNRGLTPSIRTFHSFFRILRTTDEVFELLGVMKKSGCNPQIETYIMLIRKLCRWRQFERVSELWEDIRLDGPGPDRSTYVVLIHGLFLNGKLDEAHKYYEEMKTMGFSPEPKTDEMIQAWLSGRETLAESSRLTGSDSKLFDQDASSIQQDKGNSSGSHRRIEDYRKPEIRNVTRERGFSLW